MNNLYIPNPSEIENNNDIPDDSFIPKNGNHFNSCQNKINSNYLYNSCGVYSVLLPKTIFQLVTDIQTVVFSDGSNISISIDNNCINYNSVITYSSTNTETKVIITPNNSRLLTTNCQQLSVCLNIQGQINIVSKGEKSGNDSVEINSGNLTIQRQTYVFNGCIEINPINNIDKCNPSIRQAYLPTINNNAILILNFTYLNKTFTINEIGIMLSGSDLTEQELFQILG